MEIIVILYYDKELLKRAPGCFILINNKSETSYLFTFNNFKRITY